MDAERGALVTGLIPHRARSRAACRVLSPSYIHAKRFREVVPGKFYRSGQMTADGFRETITATSIKTVINLQHEKPDPFLIDHWLGKREGQRERVVPKYSE